MRGLIRFILASFWFLVRSSNVYLAPWMKLAGKKLPVWSLNNYLQHYSRIFDNFLLGLADIFIKSPNVYIPPWKKSSWKTPNVEYVDPLPWATICSIILESLMIFFSPRAVNESRGHYARKFATRTWFLLKYVIGVTLVIFNWLCISYIHELRALVGQCSCCTVAI